MKKYEIYDVKSYFHYGKYYRTTKHTGKFFAANYCICCKVPVAECTKIFKKKFDIGSTVICTEGCYTGLKFKVFFSLPKWTRLLPEGWQECLVCGIINIGCHCEDPSHRFTIDLPNEILKFKSFKQGTIALDKALAALTGKPILPTPGPQLICEGEFVSAIKNEEFRETNWQREPCYS